MSYTVLIAEDEKVERQALHMLLLRDYGDRIEQVIEAGDGQAALELATLHHPDIIFMDIEMPGLSGLEVCARIREQNSQAKIIIVTAYTVFDYAMAAIKVQASDYLVKPYSVKSLHRIVDQVLAQAAAEQALHSQLREYSEEQQRHWMKRMMRGILPAEENRRLFGADVWYCAAALPEAAAPRLQLNGAFDTVQLCYFGLRCFLTASPQPQEQLPFSFSPSSLLCSGWKHDPAEISGFFTAALARFYQKAFPQPGRLLATVEEELRRQVTHFRFADFHPLCRELLQAALQTGGWLPQYLQEYLAYLGREAAEVLGAFPEIVRQELPEELSLEEAVHWLAAIMVQLQNQLFAASNQKYSGLVQQALQYIDEHLDQTILLEDIAEQVAVSKFYISRVFHNEMGTTLKEYVLKAKMQRAKTLLMRKEWSIGQVAERVGFADPSYFTKVFRRYVGLSPYQYRAQLHDVAES